jgi:hypothetical protein
MADARERFLEAAALLQPVMRSLRASKSGGRAMAAAGGAASSSASAGGGDAAAAAAELTMRELRQLAIAWGLPAGNESFWAQHPSVETLARVLARTARRAIDHGAALPHLDVLLRKTGSTKPAAVVVPER